MKKKNGKKKKHPQDDIRSAIFYGKTLNTPELVLRERNKFQDWFIKESHKKPNITFDQGLIQFARTRPWGKGFYTEATASDMMALRFNYLNIFNSDIEDKDISYNDPVSKEIFGEERAAILNKYFTEKDRPQEVRYISKKQFLKGVKLQAKWDNSFGREWEEISKAAFDFKTIVDFLDRSEPLFKELKKAEGCILCKAKWCLNRLPIGRQDREYCSEQCRLNEKGRRWSKNNPEKKREAQKKYLFQSQLREDGLSMEKYEVLKKVNKERTS